MPDQVLTQLPLLFSICGIAQATAAMQAFSQAMKYKDMDMENTARLLLVEMECAREHLWRILLDWPKLLNQTVHATEAAAIQPMLPAFRKALFAEQDAFALQTSSHVDSAMLYALVERLEKMLGAQVFCSVPTAWLEIETEAALHDWSVQTDSIAALLVRQVINNDWQVVGHSEVEALPILPKAALNQCLAAIDADSFIAEPRWDGQARETSALTQQADHALVRMLCEQYGNGLLARITARLVALAGIPGNMRKLIVSLEQSSVEQAGEMLPDGIGMGQVEAARGRLVHRVVLAETRVQCYQILAPTEWNFHPQGTVVCGLENLQAPDEATLRQQAALLINAVDPCVGYKLEIHY